MNPEHLRLFLADLNGAIAKDEHELRNRPKGIEAATRHMKLIARRDFYAETYDHLIDLLGEFDAMRDPE